MPYPKRKPSYLLHKSTGQARVRIDGKDIYLGPYDSPKSRDRYDQLITEWFARHGDLAHWSMTVDELVLLYMQHAESYYVKDGKPTSEVANLRVALRPLVRLYGNCPVREFSPRKLKDVRQAMIDAGCVRTSVNRQVGRIKRMFRWAVENEYVPTDVLTAIATVAGLREGRSSAIESEPTKPVDQDYIDAIEPYVSRQVWGIVQLQLLTGMRPGEAVTMRGRELIVSGRIWEYLPASHKTEHHGKKRVIFIGPQGQDILKPFLKTDLTAFLFSPAEARAEFDAKRRANRKTPMTPSQAARKRVRSPSKRPGERYTVTSYGRAIATACRKANILRWSPNQLRHTAATRIRREAGIETARCVLGHSSAITTEIYAEMDLAKAREIIARVG